MENEICIYCDEPVLPFELMPERAGCEQQFHRECIVRSVAGSVAHQAGKCSCHGGSGEDDPDKSVRANAVAAMAYFVGAHHRLDKAKAFYN